MRKNNSLQNYFTVIALSPVGVGFSGGDRILIELSRSLAKKKQHVELITWGDGMRMFKRQNLKESSYLTIHEIPIANAEKIGFFLCYMKRIIAGIQFSFRYTVKPSRQKQIFYSSSDFWMDFFPGFILKLRFPKSLWIGTYYLAAPIPLKGFREKGGFEFPKLHTILYWISQQPVYFLLKLFPDMVFVTSEPDIKHFKKQNKNGNCYVIKGGVNVDEILKWRKKISTRQKKFDAVFQGRFHPQKGVLELIDIWSEVVAKKPNAKLLMIGDGPLMSDVRKSIQMHHLENNVVLAGYVMDGVEKYTIFAKSKIVVHPAIYDSGGMAAAEAMIWGLPGVSFDLEALKTYYPLGMIKVSLYDKKIFAQKILLLLNNKKMYKKTSEEAKNLITHFWSWDIRAKEVISLVNRNF